MKKQKNKKTKKKTKINKHYFRDEVIQIFQFFLANINQYQFLPLHKCAEQRLQ